MKPLDSVTAALPEAMRNLELPPLPAPSAENAALLFGDWLTVITPLMGDLSTLSKEFWEWVQREVEAKYNEWLLAKLKNRCPRGSNVWISGRARHCWPRFLS